MKAEIDEKADTMVAGLVERGTFNAMEDLARALPGQILRENPSLVSAAFNEVLRIEAPPHAFSRLVKSDVVIDGTPIPMDARLALLFGSGNRDERHDEDPDAFRVRSNPIDHLSFATGRTLGAPADAIR